jgi:serine/threonine protein phosphatase PrpC
MVLCPYCQRQSLDERFCDHCNALLAAPDGELPARVALPDGRVIDCSPFRGWPADCSRPLFVDHPTSPLRVYALSRSWWRDLRAAVERRSAESLDILAPIRIVPVGDGALVVAESLPRAATPLPPDRADELDRVERTLDALRLLARPMQALHASGLVWLNFDPREMESAAGRVQLTNLDLLVFPAGACPDALRLSPLYSPPEVCGFEGEKFGPATDVFHLGMYAYYRLAGLLPDGFPGQGLESFDFDLPPLRIYRPALPPGVATVIRRATARDPAARYPTPADFLDRFADAAARWATRRDPSPPFRWDCAGATTIGRAHEATGLPNQDAYTMLSLDRERSLYIVADGVTTCSVGAGEIASRLAVDVLAAELPGLLARASTSAEIESALNQGCARASESILRRALAENPPEGVDPSELMSSTVLIGYAHGTTLSVACVGDSRAFLVTESESEQLTVDGDVRCVHLAHGTSPEQVRGLGGEALALFSCLGVGEPGPEGGLVRCSLRTQPPIVHWPMRDHDIVVLATDGLVEEGAYLDPEDLSRIVRESRLAEQESLSEVFGPALLPAAALAERCLVAAQRTHRDASEWEPHGCGDDVTCIVLRARRGAP